MSYYDRSPIRCATHGMSEEQARRWWTDNAPPVGLHDKADLGPKVPCETLKSGRHNCGKRCRRGPVEYAQHGFDEGRAYLPVRDYYHQAHVLRSLAG